MRSVLIAYLLVVDGKGKHELGLREAPRPGACPVEQAHRRVKQQRLLVCFLLGLALELLGLAFGGHLLVVDDLADAVLTAPTTSSTLPSVRPAALAASCLASPATPSVV